MNYITSIAFRNFAKTPKAFVVLDGETIVIKITVPAGHKVTVKDFGIRLNSNLEIRAGRKWWVKYVGHDGSGYIEADIKNSVPKEVVNFDDPRFSAPKQNS